MIQRRRLLASLGTTSVALSLSGCTGEEPQEQSDSEAETETESGTDPIEEDETVGLQGIAIDNINLTYNFSSGLRARIELRNEIGDEILPVNIRIAAYDGDQLLGDNSEWENFSAGYIREIDLTIESIGSLADYDIEDVTDFVITGRFEGEESVEIERLDGDTLRQRVDA